MDDNAARIDTTQQAAGMDPSKAAAALVIGAILTLGVIARVFRGHNGG